jgi:hypothetical protein
VCYVITLFWERTKWLWILIFNCMYVVSELGVIFGYNCIFVFSSDVLAHVLCVM